jgi:hypothetical protein
MKKVWIFGDSYAEKKRMDDFVWTRKIEERYDVRNFAQSGTGPTWSLKKLHDEIENNKGVDLTDVSVIFLISSIFRIDLRFFSDPKSQIATLPLSRGGLTPLREMFAKPYMEFQPFLTDFYDYHLSMDSYQDTEMSKIIGYLKLHEPLFEKMLVWPIFDEVTTTIPMSSDTFFFVPNLLNRLEYQNPQKGPDQRANHFSEVNHPIMLEQLTNWIDFSLPVDTSNFRFSGA